MIGIHYFKIYFRINHTVHVYCPHVLPTCIAHVYCPHVLPTCIAHVYCPRVLFTCIVHVYCPRVLPTCIVHVYCPRVWSWHDMTTCPQVLEPQAQLWVWTGWHGTAHYYKAGLHTELAQGALDWGPVFEGSTRHSREFLRVSTSFTKTFRFCIVEYFCTPFPETLKTTALGLFLPLTVIIFIWAHLFTDKVSDYASVQLRARLLRGALPAFRDIRGESAWPGAQHGASFRYLPASCHRNFCHFQF